jgi:hypothetical protein
MDIAVLALALASVASAAAFLVGLALAIYRGWRPRRPRIFGRRRFQIR